MFGILGKPAASGYLASLLSRDSDPDFRDPPVEFWSTFSDDIAAVQPDPGWIYGNILPLKVQRDDQGNITSARPAWPLMVHDLVNAVMEMSLAAHGHQLPATEDNPRGGIDPRAAFLATSAMMGLNSPIEAIGSVARSSEMPLAAEETFASRNPSLYNPPVKLPRPFEADYPSGVVGNAGEKIATDVDGRVLGAPYIVGRRVVGGPDEALSPTEYDAVTKGLIGQVPQGYPARALPRGAVGVYRVTPGPDGPERSIGFLQSLSPNAAARVTAHEIGHMINDLAGNIPITGLSTELRQLYNTLFSGRERTRQMTGPQHLGYNSEEVPSELMAEAIRAYMADPNYLKTVAPKTAAAIRAAVNSNPRLSAVIQFNSRAPSAMWGIPFMTQDQQP